MEIEFWWLLALPVFFALGWFAARIDIKQLLSESRVLPLSYFKGLNFLLTEQPDKAIEAFIEVVKVDPQTIELHFALGGLFRRRGEVEHELGVHREPRPDRLLGLRDAMVPVEADVLQEDSIRAQSLSPRRRSIASCRRLASMVSAIR